MGSAFLWKYSVGFSSQVANFILFQTLLLIFNLSGDKVRDIKYETRQEDMKNVMQLHNAADIIIIRIII